MSICKSTNSVRINEKGGHEYEREQGVVYVRVFREEREMESDMYYNIKNKRNNFKYQITKDKVMGVGKAAEWGLGKVEQGKILIKGMAQNSQRNDKKGRKEKGI